MRKKPHESGRRIWLAPASGRRDYRRRDGPYPCATAVWQNEHAQGAYERAGSELRKQRRQHQSEKQRYFGLSAQARGYESTDADCPNQQHWANGSCVWDNGGVYECSRRLIHSFKMCQRYPPLHCRSLCCHERPSPLLLMTQSSSSRFQPPVTNNKIS